MAPERSNFILVVKYDVYEPFFIAAEFFKTTEDPSEICCRDASTSEHAFRDKTQTAWKYSKGISKLTFFQNSRTHR